MITVTMLRTGGGIEGFTCAGHADYDESGRDIVCSAVSALTQTCILGLTDVIGVKAGVSMDETDGIVCILDRDAPKERKKEAELLFRTLEAGLRSIRQAYPKNLKIIDREV